MFKQLVFLPLIFSVVFGNSCPKGTIEYQSNCYLFNSTETGFAAAEISCANLGGHLASIHDAFANDMLAQIAQNYFHGSTNSDFWIGANNLITNGRWNWTDGTNFDFNNWNKDEPSDVLGSNCAAVSLTDGRWAAQDCFKAKPFICHLTSTPVYPTFANCSNGWVYLAATGSCYGVNPSGLIDTWHASETYCEKLEAVLPSINNFAEIQLLTSFVYEMWVAFWINVYSIDGKTWKTSQGEPADFLKYGDWCPGYPQPVDGETCIYIGSLGNGGCYRNYGCNNKQYTLCKKNTFLTSFV